MKFRYEKIIEIECDGTLIDAIISIINKHKTISNSELIDMLEPFINKEKTKSMIISLVELGIIQFGPHLKLILSSDFSLDIVKKNYPKLFDIKLNQP